jgi:hypothetical protein
VLIVQRGCFCTQPLRSLIFSPNGGVPGSYLLLALTVMRHVCAIEFSWVKGLLPLLQMATIQRLSVDRLAPALAVRQSKLQEHLKTLFSALLFESFFIRRGLSC